MKRKSRIVIGLFLGFAAIVILSANGKKIIKEANSSTTADFVTVKVSGLSDLPQGETEIVADNNGHVVVVWMDGSEAWEMVGNGVRSTFLTSPIDCATYSPCPAHYA